MYLPVFSGPMGCRRAPSFQIVVLRSLGLEGSGVELEEHMSRATWRFMGGYHLESNPNPATRKAQNYTLLLLSRP